MGTQSYFSTNFRRGNNFCDSVFASLDNLGLLKQGLQRKNLFLEDFLMREKVRCMCNFNTFIDSGNFLHLHVLV